VSRDVLLSYKVKGFDEIMIGKKRFESMFIDGTLSEVEWEYLQKNFNKHTVFNSVYDQIRKEVVRLFTEEHFENTSRKLLGSCYVDGGE
jgi:hypothetical protein